MNTTQRALITAAVGALVAGIVAGVLAVQPDEPVTPAVRATAALPEAPQPATTSNAAPASAGTAHAQTRLPRPSPTSATDLLLGETPASPPATAPASPPAHGLLDEGAGTGPVDRRAQPHGDNAQVIQDIQAGMETARLDIAECIDAWAQVDPNIDGHVVVRFAIGPDGLQDAWIEDHSDVPAGPLSCFASAVWEVDWADITDEDLEISYPFEVSTGD